MGHEEAFIYRPLAFVQGCDVAPILVFRRRSQSTNFLFWVPLCTFDESLLKGRKINFQLYYHYRYDGAKLYHLLAELNVQNVRTESHQFVREYNRWITDQTRNRMDHCVANQVKYKQAYIYLCCTTTDFI